MFLSELGMPYRPLLLPLISARQVTVIAEGNGLGDLRSNPACGDLHFTWCEYPWEKYPSKYSPSSYEYTVG